jgi:multidrug efflux system membrane fusion protein
MGPGRTRIQSSYVIAAVLALLATAWILSGVIGGSSSPADAPAENSVVATPEAPLTKVRVTHRTAEMHRQEIVLRGQTEASRSVELKAETSSVVEVVNVDEGSVVAEGQVILEMERNYRDSRLAEARALVAQRQAEFNAAQKLSKKGFTAATRLAEAKALRDAAQATLTAIELDLEDTKVEAPFDGILETRYVEVGDFLEVGDRVARIMDLDPLNIVVHVSERDIGRLAYGESAKARLVSGQTVSGHVTYIGSAADPQTRTFRVEIEVPNPGHKLAQGISTEIRLAVDQVKAHRVSPAILTLDDDGNVGIKTVNSDDIVEFHPIQIVADESDGI